MLELFSGISPENLFAEDDKYPRDFSTPECTRKPPALHSAVKTVRPTNKPSRPTVKTKCPTTPHSLQKSSQRLIHHTLHATQKPDGGAFSIFGDDGCMRVIRSATPLKTYKESSSKTSRKDTTTGTSISSTSVTKPKAVRSLAKKISKEENVYDRIDTTNSPIDIVLEVPRSYKTKTYKNISKQKESGDTVEEISIEQFKKSKKGVENLNDTNNPQTKNPNDVVLVPMSSQIKKHKNSPWQKGSDDAEKVPASSTTKPQSATETKSSANPDGSQPILAQVKETRRRGRPSKSVSTIDVESKRTTRKTTKVNPPCFEDESKKTPSTRSRGRPTRSTLR